MSDDITPILEASEKSLVDYHYILLSGEGKYTEPAEFHHRLSDILLKERDNFAIEAFRESGKSTIVLQSFPLYCLTFPSPDRSYIVIIKDNQRLASAKLKEIADIYTTHDILKNNIVEIKQQSEKIFEVVVLKKGGGKQTVRIEAYGKGAAIRGLNWATKSEGVKRPDIVIIDDPQDLEDSMSETVMDKDWQWFMADVVFLGKYSRIFLIGNNLGENCIVERVINSESFKDGVFQFNSMRIPAMEEDKATWEEQFSVEYLLKEKEAFAREGELDTWYRERMCISQSEENRKFKKEYFKHFEEEDIQGKDFKYYVALDVAISEKESADRTVFTVVAKELQSPNWYIVEQLRVTSNNPIDVIDQMFYLYNEYRFVKIGIEGVAYQAALEHFVKEEMKKRETYFSVEMLKNRKKTKYERIMGLQPLFHTGVIHHRVSNTELEGELLTFPKGKHDDYIDSLAMILEVIEQTRPDNAKATEAAQSRLNKLLAKRR